MKDSFRSAVWVLVFLGAWVPGSLRAGAPAGLERPAKAALERTLNYNRFGTVHLYGSGKVVDRVMILLSGDVGWNQALEDLSRDLAARDALVLGVNLNQYLKSASKLKGRCSYATADFEGLSQYAQQALQLGTYHVPALVGVSSGGAMAYALLKQAPAGTFRGALSLGFCPGLKYPKAPCKGAGLETNPGEKGAGFLLLPGAVSAPWVVIRGSAAGDCDAGVVEGFVKASPGARLVSIPPGTPGTDPARRWLPEFEEAYLTLKPETESGATSQQVNASVADLPLVEVPAQAAEGDRLAVMLSGDGGWAGIDKAISAHLAKAGIPAVGLNCQKYLWGRKTPDQASGALARIMRNYLAAWNKKSVILIGYSRGAEVLPFLVTRLPADLKARVELAVFLGVEHRTDLKVHLMDLIHSTSGREEYTVLPEFKKLKGMHLLLFYGEEEGDTIGPEVPEGLATV